MCVPLNLLNIADIVCWCGAFCCEHTSLLGFFLLCFIIFLCYSILFISHANRKQICHTFIVLMLISVVRIKFSLKANLLLTNVLFVLLYLGLAVDWYGVMTMELVVAQYKRLQSFFFFQLKSSNLSRQGQYIIKLKPVVISACYQAVSITDTRTSILYSFYWARYLWIHVIATQLVSYSHSHTLGSCCSLYLQCCSARVSISWA